MHSRWMRVIRQRKAEMERSLSLRIRIVLALVGVLLVSRTFPSSKRGTSTQVILLLPGTIMTKGTTLASRRAVIEIPSITTSRMVSVDVCEDVSVR